MAHRSYPVCHLFLYRMIFTILNELLKNSKDKYFMTYENDVKYKFQSPQIRFYWNMAIFLHTQIAYVCFSATVAVMSG